jgi:hypothetical protein
VALIGQIADRDAKADAYHVAVGHVQDSQAEVGQHISSFALLLRGKLGPKNPTLTKFGVKPLVPGKRAKAAAPPAASPPPAAAPPLAAAPAK